MLTLANNICQKKRYFYIFYLLIASSVKSLTELYLYA
jgi:hypothetical protein